MARLDLTLWKMGLAKSRTHAQDLIKASRVVLLKPNCEERILTKVSYDVSVEDSQCLKLRNGDSPDFVSRGGTKLHGALRELDLRVKDWRALDIGTSTGGFADCLIQEGCSEVIGIDVGHNQIHPTLKNETKLKLLEGLNIKEISLHSEYQKLRPTDGFELVVIDVSFIGLEKVIPFVVGEIKRPGYLLALVKPQFELGASALNRQGIVKDPSHYLYLEKKMKEICSQFSLTVIKYFESSIKGREGNREFFIFAQS